MKAFLLICAGILFLGAAPLPIGYYTFLRIITTLGCIGIIVSEYKTNNDFSMWVILFGIIAILFNPIIPIHFYEKAIWIPIDVIVGILFLVKAVKLNK